MRKQHRDKELAAPFLLKQAEQIRRRGDALIQLIERMSLARNSLTQAAEKVSGYQEGTRVRRRSSGWSLSWMWRASRRSDHVLPIEVYLSTGSKGQGTFSQLSLKPRETRLSLMTPLLGRKGAAKFSKDLDSFFLIAAKCVDWINAFPGEDVAGLMPQSKAYGLERWLDLVSEGCELRSSKAAGLVECFLKLDEELDHLVFEFNDARQPVRYRSIICRRECSSLDALAPSEPRYRVVDYFDRRTGRRSSRDISSYKQRLQAQKLRERLVRALGREPTQDEVGASTQRKRKRVPSPWLTPEIVSHCHLGKHSGAIFNHQKRMAMALDRWESCRNQIRSLL